MKTNCKYYGSCGNSENCARCTGYEAKPKMTNKEYRAAAAAAQDADELYTFEHYYGGLYPTKYMNADDIKEMRTEYKDEIRNKKAFALKQFGNRALIIPVDGALILKSYYTEVARYDMKTDEFSRLWNGFSVTTLKHINIFREFLGLETINKRAWIEMEVK